MSTAENVSTSRRDRLEYRAWRDLNLDLEVRSSCAVSVDLLLETREALDAVANLLRVEAPV